MQATISYPRPKPSTTRWCIWDAKYYISSDCFPTYDSVQSFKAQKVTETVPWPFGETIKSTIAISTNPFTMRRTRHIEIRHKKVIECVKAKFIKLVFVPSDENISDIFTK